MKPLLLLLARLYPLEWRNRYGTEFDALIEDARPGLGGALDILKGALTMQFASLTPLRVLCASVLAGVLIAFGIGYTLPKQWSSVAIIQIAQNGQDAKTPDRIIAASNAAFSRSALTEIIREGGLYPDQLKASPLEDVIERFKRAVQVTSSPGVGFQVRFVYQDPRLAQKVAQAIASNFVAVEPEAFRLIEVGPQQPVNTTFSAKLAAAGLGGGLLIGAPLALLLHLRRRKQAAIPSPPPATSGI